MLAFVYSCFYFVLILWVLLALVWEFGYHPGPSLCLQILDAILADGPLNRYTDSGLC